MSKKRKWSQSDELPVKSDDITFGVFFTSCVIRGQVRAWQEKEIHAFFKDLGLKDKEPVDKYKDALAKY